MDTQMIVEVIGYIGSILVVISMLMSSVIKLRIINSIGSCIFAAYALIINSYPTALMNFCLVTINIYNLVKLMKVTNKQYELIDGRTDDTFLKYLLDYYKEDIKKFFPEFKYEQNKDNVAYIICCDANPAGILLGEKNSEGLINITLDYSTSMYRDCSVGEYLYKQLVDKGIRKLVYSGRSELHESYLQKMGFMKSNISYIKSL